MVSTRAISRAEALNKPKSSATLLSLPIELHVQIFRSLLTSYHGDILVMDRMLHVAKQEYSGPPEAEWDIGTVHLRHSQWTRLFLISSYLYETQVRIFYAENCFLFDCCGTMASFLSTIGRTRRRYVSSVVLYEGPRCYEEDGIRAFKLLGSSHCLTHLEIRFEQLVGNCHQLEEYVDAKDDPNAEDNIWLDWHISGTKAMVGPGCGRYLPVWDWYYDEVRELQDLRGFEVLEKFRGLETLTFLDRRLLEPPYDQDQSEYLIQCATRPKRLASGEDEFDVAAIRQFSATPDVASRKPAQPGQQPGKDEEMSAAAGQKRESAFDSERVLSKNFSARPFARGPRSSNIFSYPRADASDYSEPDSESGSDSDNDSDSGSGRVPGCDRESGSDLDSGSGSASASASDSDTNH